MLAIADYVVLGLTLAVSAGIGLYYRKHDSSKDYLLADGSMSSLPVAFSLMASFMSSITLLGVTNENYTFGTQFIAINFAYIIGTPVAAYLYLPVFFRQNSASAYAYLEKRFGLLTRLAASLAFTTQMILYMGIVLYAPAIALSAVTGLSYMGAILSVGLVCTFYSTLGGIKGVLITDVFQSLLMFSAVGLVVFGGTYMVGGFVNVIEIANAGDRLELFKLDPDPTVRHTFWSQIIGGTFIYCSIYAVNQAQVQRLMSTKSLRTAQAALWIQWPILAALSLTTSYAGLVMYAFYLNCDPVKAGKIAKGDQLLPYFVVDTMSSYPGLSGLFISGIFSGALSTVSSAINSLAAVTLEDYIKPAIGSRIPVEREPLLLKILAASYGLLSIVLSFLVEHMGKGVLQASLTIFGVVGGPLLGLFSLGMFLTRPRQPGALAGFFVSLALLFWIGFGSPKPKPIPLPTNGYSGCNSSATLPQEEILLNNSSFVQQQAEEQQSYFWPYCISYAWYAFIGFVVTLLVGYSVSVLLDSRCKTTTTTTEQPLDANLFFTPLRNKILRDQQKQEQEQHNETRPLNHEPEEELKDLTTKIENIPNGNGKAVYHEKA